MSNEYKLTQAICELSNSKIWSLAKTEWNLDIIYQQDKPETCLCGHYPIKEICVLRNKLNGNSANVGNVCVNRFIGLPSDKLFRSVKAVEKNQIKLFIEELIDLVFKKGWINNWENEFYSNIRVVKKDKKTLTEKQRTKILGINKKILFRIAISKIENSQS